jgi:4-hydroxy-2-oxoheptanedioate aldolase
MRKNALKQLFAKGGNAVMGWLGIPNSLSAEIMAHAGWDAITIDMQHGAVPHGEIVPMLQAISTTTVTPLVRVPWNEPGIIMRVLDAGAYGIICPMVNTVAQAEALVQATRYPPLGARSNGPFRAMMYGGPDYVSQANQEILVFAMIETVEAIDNLDRILKVKGLDGTYVGPSDLSLSMGEPPSLAPTSKKVIDGIKTIAARTAKAGLIAGVHCDSPKTVKERFAQGYRFGTILNDSRLLAVAAANAVKEAKGEAATASAKTY